MTDQGSTRARSLEVLGELMGGSFAEQVGKRIDSGAPGSALTGIAADLAFATVWGRDGLDRRARSLVTLGVLIALHAKEELEHHFNIGMRNGLTAAELEEVVIQTMPYAGITAAGPAMGVLGAILREGQSKRS